MGLGTTAKPLYAIDGKDEGLDRRSPLHSRHTRHKKHMKHMKHKSRFS